MFMILDIMITLLIFLIGLCLSYIILNPIIMKGFYKSYKNKGGKKTYKQYVKMFNER